MGISKPYMRFVKKFKWFVIAFWFATLIFGVCFGLKFQGLASNDLPPVKGTKSYDATQNLKHYFPDQANIQQWSVLFKSQANIINEDTKIMVNSISDTIDDFEKERNVKIVVNMESYYDLEHRGSEFLKYGFVNENQSAMLVALSIDQDQDDSDRYDLVDKIVDKIDQLKHVFPTYTIEATGSDLIAHEVNNYIIKDITIGEAIVLPFAFALLLYMVKSWKFLILCFYNIGIALMGAMAIMYWECRIAGLKPQSTGPQFIEVMVLAVTIDYSLFVFTRFRKEMEEHGDFNLAMENTACYAGHVVLMSGLTLVVSFCGFFALETPFIYNMGIGNAIGVFLGICVNLSNSFAIMYVAPGFFSTFTYCPCSKGSNPMVYSKIPDIRRSWWFQSAKVMVTFPYNVCIIIAVYIAVIPLTIKALQFKTANSISLVVDEHTQSYVAIKDIEEAFGPGNSNPISVLFMGEVQTEDYFKTGHQMIESLGGVKGLDERNFGSIFRNFTGANIGLEDSKVLLNTSVDYQILWEQSVSSKLSASIINIIPSFDPYEDSRTFIADIRDALALLPQKYEYHLCGSAVSMQDTTDFVFHLFPRQIWVTCVAAFSLMAILLWSAVVPFRLALTIICPLGAVFGFAVLVYQEGILEWTHWSGVESKGHFFWDVSIFCFTICIGLALDYDVFLVSRIFEHRIKGLTTQAAIVLAVYETAYIITSAGLIMSACFCTELIIPGLAVNQIGFIMLMAVLFDTFIVRTCLVPAVFSLWDCAGYWPTKVPHDNLLGLEELPSYYNKRFENNRPFRMSSSGEVRDPINEIDNVW